MPVWSRDGSKIYYASPFNIVDITVGSGVRASNPRPMFKQPIHLNANGLTLFPDGHGFIGIQNVGGKAVSNIEVRVDWASALP